MRTLTFALAVLLLGCATPSELRQDGIRTDYTLRLPPAQAARCMVRVAEEYFTGFVASVRETENPNTREIHVRTDISLVAIAYIEPKGSGSLASIWRGSIPLIAHGLPDAMGKGC